MTPGHGTRLPAMDPTSLLAPQTGAIAFVGVHAARDGMPEVAERHVGLAGEQAGEEPKPHLWERPLGGRR